LVALGIIAILNHGAITQDSGAGKNRAASAQYDSVFNDGEY
jgi:hypothetical protein